MASPAAKIKSKASNESLRRSRSLSRAMTPDYIKNAARGKFVNTERGSFPEIISLDDLATEFFSSSEREQGQGRTSVSIGGRWARDTESSKRRGRSVSRYETRTGSGSSDAPNTRRRSLSVARYQTQSHVDQSSIQANVKAPLSRNGQMPLTSKTPTSGNRRHLSRSQSHKDLNDGYSSHSSALTEDEPKITRLRKNEVEKIVRVVHTQNKPEHPTEDVADGCLYEAVRKELRYAVEEIRTELNQAMVRNQTASTGGELSQSDDSLALQEFYGMRNSYVSKLEQLEKSKYDILTEMPLEGQRGHEEVSKKVKKCSTSRISAVAEKPSRARKRSNDRNRMSRRLSDEAEKIFEDFLSNIEDTDLSSFDGERSDGCSTLGGTKKDRDAEKEIYKSPGESTSRPVEMDGVTLPWLQWETCHDGSPSGKNNAGSPVTPKTLQWDSEKDVVLLHGPSGYSGSSHGSWSPAHYTSPVDMREETTEKNMQVVKGSSEVDMEEYFKLGNNEELLFEMYRERNRISSGGLLLCSGLLY